ncbi:hypothetical protein HMPREF0373_00570 [Eubacterium ramulus ATCC 29099]|uniref:Uncharacterized protein n=1 Tax=Eubacterium ramulus ATCC 29099 TaxID=1256908 RepID=U2Q3Z7_EUBRA|nr:hypothetical protein HMPREF0373_00570 [Eubacterium ramulus ATCC 29099]
MCKRHLFYFSRNPDKYMSAMQTRISHQKSILSSELYISENDI